MSRSTRRPLLPSILINHGFSQCTPHIRNVPRTIPRQNWKAPSLAQLSCGFSSLPFCNGFASVDCQVCRASEGIWSKSRSKPVNICLRHIPYIPELSNRLMIRSGAHCPSVFGIEKPRRILGGTVPRTDAGRGYDHPIWNQSVTLLRSSLTHSASSDRCFRATSGAEFAWPAIR